MSKSRWVTPESLSDRADRSWPEVAGTHVVGQRPWEPRSYTLTPSPSISWMRDNNLRDALRWAKTWKDFVSQIDGLKLQMRQARVPGRGTQTLPKKLEVTTQDGFLMLTGRVEDARQLRKVARSTEAKFPQLSKWLGANAPRVLANAGHWSALMRCLAWFRDTPDRSSLFVRQVDVPGIDTKFIEQHRQVLLEMAAALNLPGIDASQADWRDALGLRAESRWIYVNGLRNWQPVPGVNTWSLPLDQARLLVPCVSTVFIVENKLCWAEFPAVPDSLVLWGAGRAAAAERSGLQHLPWLRGKRVLYWGDLDQAGFAIAASVRRELPGAETIMMDLLTLQSHKASLVPDTSRIEQTSGLTSAERKTLSHLRSTGSRLEQEYIPLDYVRSQVERALGLHREGP